MVRAQAENGTMGAVAAERIGLIGLTVNWVVAVVLGRQTDAASFMDAFIEVRVASVLPDMNSNASYLTLFNERDRWRAAQKADILSTHMRIAALGLGALDGAILLDSTDPKGYVRQFVRFVKEDTNVEAQIMEALGARWTPEVRQPAKQGFPIR